LNSLKVVVLSSGDQLMGNFEFDLSSNHFIIENPVMLKPVREENNILLIPYLLPTSNTLVLLNRQYLVFEPLEPNEHLIQMYNDLFSQMKK
jgi:hypothetical protein